MLYVKKIDTGTCHELPNPVYVRRQKNGVAVCVGSLTLAQGVLSPDGAEIWQLSGAEALGDGYEEVQIITAAEYDQWTMEQIPPEEPDPEDTDPIIPEDMEPATVLTRAELTEKVNELDEALNLLLSGVTEDET